MQVGFVVILEHSFPSFETLYYYYGESRPLNVKKPSQKLAKIACFYYAFTNVSHLYNLSAFSCTFLHSFTHFLSP